MATITLQVTEYESPVEGAEVIVGSMAGRSFITDANGEKTLTVDEDYKVVVFVSVKLDGDLRHTSSSQLLEAGGTYAFDITHTAEG